MAQIPSEELLKNLQNETQEAIDKEIAKNIKYIPSDGGIIPKEVWKSLKEPKL